MTDARSSLRAGDHGAIAALVALLLGLRATEIATLQHADHDERVTADPERVADRIEVLASQLLDHGRVEQRDRDGRVAYALDPDGAADLRAACRRSCRTRTC
jgi:hypothetical protein